MHLAAAVFAHSPDIFQILIDDVGGERHGLVGIGIDWLDEQLAAASADLAHPCIITQAVARTDQGLRVEPALALGAEQCRPLA